MTENTRLIDLIDALEKRIHALEKEVLTSRIRSEADQEFIAEVKGYVKRFYYTVTISLGAIILWLVKSVIEKAGIGL